MRRYRQGLPNPPQDWETRLLDLTFCLVSLPPMSARTRPKVSDQVRNAIEGCRYRIWKETGVAQETLSRFMKGERGLSMKALDKIGEFLEWELKSRRRGGKED